MLSKRDPAGYNLVEVEMILNYFPHGVWSYDDHMNLLREKFYAPLFDTIVANLEAMPCRQFVSIF